MRLGYLTIIKDIAIENNTVTTAVIIDIPRVEMVILKENIIGSPCDMPRISQKINIDIGMINASPISNPMANREGYFHMPN